MKTFQIKTRTAPGRNPAGSMAMTLIEIMTTMGIFSMVVMAMVYVHIFGLHQDQLIESKLGASDQSRREFEQLGSDIRGAQTTAIGNVPTGNYSGQPPFGPIPLGTSQQGNALQVQPFTGPSPIIYYFDTGTPGNYFLRRYQSGDTTNTVVACHLTNYYGGALTFTSEKYDGTITTETSDRMMIHVTLGFIQYQYPLTVVGGSNALYDFYKMEFRFTPHVPQG